MGVGIRIRVEIRIRIRVRVGIGVRVRFMLRVRVSGRHPIKDDIDNWRAAAGGAHIVVWGAILSRHPPLHSSPLTLLLHPLLTYFLH